MASAGHNFRSHSGSGDVTWNDPVIMTACALRHARLNRLLLHRSVRPRFLRHHDYLDDIAGYIEPGQSIVTVFSDPGTYAVASGAWD